LRPNFTFAQPTEHLANPGSKLRPIAGQRGHASIAAKDHYRDCRVFVSARKAPQPTSLREQSGQKLGWQEVRLGKEKE